MGILKKILLALSFCCLGIVAYGCYAFHILEVGGTGATGTGYPGCCGVTTYDMDGNQIEDTSD